MAKLTESERAQLKRAAVVEDSPPKPRVLSPAEYVAFATLASKAVRTRKPAPISGGKHWKL